jgi:hypothetical protein
MNTNSDVEIIQFIKTKLKTIGQGVEGDPVRIITQYWDMTGKLIFEVDPYAKEVKYYLFER